MEFNSYTNAPQQVNLTKDAMLPHTTVCSGRGRPLCVLLDACTPTVWCCFVGAVQFVVVRKQNNLRPHASYIADGISECLVTAFESNEGSYYEKNKNRKRD